MSKSLGNYIGISEEPEVIYEKVMKIPDSLIIKYYNLCTDVHPDEIKKLQRKLEEGSNPRDIKMMLAGEITRLYHGQEGAERAEKYFETVFQKSQVPENVPTIIVDPAFQAAYSEQVLQELVKQGFYKSKNEIRRIFKQGGAYYDGEKLLDSKDILPGEGEHILKLGKSSFFKICL